MNYLPNIYWYNWLKSSQCILARLLSLALCLGRFSYSKRLTPVTVAYTVCNCPSSLVLPLPQEDDDGPLGAPEYDTISENGLLSRNEPIRSKVSKLTEKLRKRYPTTSTGQSALTHPLLCFVLLYLSDERRIFLTLVSYLICERMHCI